MKTFLTILLLICSQFYLKALPIDSSKIKAEQVVEDFIQSIKSSQFNNIGNLYHPESLGELKRYLIQISQVEKDHQSKKMLFRSYGLSDSCNVNEIDSMALISNYYKSAMYSLPSSSKLGSIKIIGSIQEGQDTIHVLVRNEVSVFGFSIGAVEVNTLRRKANNGFGLLLPDKLVIMLRAAIFRNSNNQIYK